MNERIKELAKQAKEWVNSIPDFWDTCVDRDMLFQKKFAELIVKECASLTLDFSKPSADYYHGWLDYRDEILRHFGVEE